MTDAETQKLDRIEAKVDRICKILHGHNGDGLGVIAKVNILWRSWWWLLCTLSACGAWLLRGMVDKGVF